MSTLGLARLNPGAKVLGVDGSPRSLERARERAQVAGLDGVEFRAHDLEQPLPAAWGPFDFIVCRRVLGQVDDPVQVLRNLARALDHRGLLHVTFPSSAGRLAARQMRQAVDALAEPEMNLAERARLGLELFQALCRPDHPIRRYETGITGADVPSLERFITGFLNDSERHWTLEDATRLLDQARLQFLFAATRWPWRADRVLVAAAASADLKARVGQLTQRRQAELIDALDPVLHLDEYRIYACLAEYEPRIPTWAEEGRDAPEVLDRLIPHRTEIARPDATAQPSAPGRVVYRTVNGALGELDRRSDLLIRGINGVSSCAQISVEVSAALGVAEESQARRSRWLDLANGGFILLESPDPRQHVDCTHLGAVLDRLDCPCPRLWVRACELHGHCTITRVGPDDEKFAALTAALQRQDITKVAACSDCPDYSSEE